LALLLSTSGSTGSPKLVRLSAENLQANAEAIAE
jgi:long-subunit acyl-CoA synthetase (AMP-forming)